MSAEPVPTAGSVVETHRDHDTCANCGTHNRGAYCSSCGQKRVHEGDLGLAHAWHHLLHETLHLDGKIVQSVKLLFLKPGQLALDFIEGRRARHVHPIRLFLVFTALFLLFEGGTFTAARMIGPRGKPRLEEKARREGIPYEVLVQRIDRRLTNTFKASYIASVVVSGLVLWLAFRKRRPYLAEHIVVTMLAACVSMTVCVLVAACLPKAWMFSVWLIPSGVLSFGTWYLARSLHVVYGATPRQVALLSGICLFFSQLIVMGTLLYMQTQAHRL